MGVSGRARLRIGGRLLRLRLLHLAPGLHVGQHVLALQQRALHALPLAARGLQCGLQLLHLRDLALQLSTSRVRASPTARISACMHTQSLQCGVAA